MADSYPFLDEGEVENSAIHIVETGVEEGIKDTTGSIINCTVSECNRKSIKKCQICNESYVCCQHCRAYEKVNMYNLFVYSIILILLLR